MKMLAENMYKFNLQKVSVNKMPNLAFQAPLQHLFRRLHQIWEREYIHSLLSVVYISNT